MRFYLVLPFVILSTIYYSIVSMIVVAFDRSGRGYHSIMRQWSRLLLWLFGIKTVVKGTENIPPGTSHIFLANHSSYLDIITLGVTIPDDIRFIFKRELAKIPIFGWGLAHGPYILIDRTDARNAMASIERAAKQIGEGASVVIFPEGTRSGDGKLGPFKRGGFLLATKSGVPMLPVAIRGTYQLLSRHDSRVRSGRVEVIIGHPIEEKPNATRAEEQAIQNEVRQQLVAMLETGEPPVRNDERGAMNNENAEASLQSQI
jgi:1-acyl-sn-glycerol-3-phosphate acyltransferase